MPKRLILSRKEFQQVQNSIACARRLDLVSLELSWHRTVKDKKSSTVTFKMSGGSIAIDWWSHTRPSWSEDNRRYFPASNRGEAHESLIKFYSAYRESFGSSDEVQENEDGSD